MLIEHTTLPHWSFAAAQFLAQKRHGRFRQRFPNKRFIEIHRSQPYAGDGQSIIGYMGDIAAAIFLGADPIDMLDAMISATDGLTHRDEGDITHNCMNIDVKIEDFANSHELVLSGKILPNQPYGCRLINEEQWQENHEGTDEYLFGCFDPPIGPCNLLHQARRIAWIGCISSEEVAKMAVAQYSPAGRQLHTPARIIPNGKLRPANSLKNASPGNRTPVARDLTNQNNAERIRILKAELRKHVENHN